METRRAFFRVESSRETGEVKLSIATACGFRPVMAWPDTVRLREFTGMLLGICDRIDRRDYPEEIPENFLKEFLEEE